MDLSVKHPWMTKRGSHWYLRAKVPADIALVFPHREVKKSLQTTDRIEACRRIHAEAAKVEALFAHYRLHGRAPLPPSRIIRHANVVRPRYQGTGLPPSDLKSSEMLSIHQRDELVAKERARWRHWVEKPVLGLSVESRDEQAQILEMDAGWRGSREDEANEGWLKASLVLERSGYYFDDRGDIGMSLAERLLEIESEAARMRANRLRGLSSALPIANTSTSDLALQGDTSKLRQGRTLDEVLAEYDCDPDRKSISRKTQVEDQRAFSIMREIFGGDTDIRAIRKGECREFKSLIRRLPKNAQICCRGLNAKQAADEAGRRGLPLLSAKGANKYIHKLAAVMKFAVDHDYVEGINPARGLALPQKHSIDDRLPHTSEAIACIFGSERFLSSAQSAHKIGSGAFFWIPLLAILMGLRQSEACQLEAGDFKSDDGVWYIDLVGDERRRLKTENSARRIPCHPTLMRFGLRLFVEDLKSDGGTAARLFPEEEKGRDDYYSPYSKRFTRFLSSVGAKTPKTCFHSLRHNFRDALRQAEVSESIAFLIGGWKEGWGSTGNIYGSRPQIGVLSQAVASVHYAALPVEAIAANIPAHRFR